MSFAWELCKRAWDSAVASMGTTTLAVVLTIIAFLLYALFNLWRYGWAGMKYRLGENIKGGLLISAALWIVVIGYHLFYKVPHAIISQAESVSVPRIVIAPPKPPLWAFARPLKLPPLVTIAPSRVVFGLVPPGAFSVLSDMYTFRIRNMSGADLYTITFKLRIESASVPLSDFKLDVPKSSWRASSETDPVGSQYGDISGMDCSDVKGRTVFLGEIFHLLPHDYRELTLTHVNPNSASPTAQGELPRAVTVPSAKSGGIAVRSEISHFSKTQESVMSGNGMYLWPFYNDELLKCSGAFFIKIK